ncbi:hypothetical protein [Alloyangia pacifica]|uniref:Uncharacterized protein n=1 Tax=Alloyangia pacifica TaxID=311180 RepID=A0A1I6SA15_9RHOB|nr:hypothetical protein [Alloyangia pacifica]SDG74090.1 hypothetical protein SAMN04488245_104222 [Alloyangia pacifica]SFS73786.1 hypothetical protein SAMN04488050_104222 [Alloyangia pacifica]
MTPAQKHGEPVQGVGRFASTRPDRARRDQAGWVPLQNASRNLLGNARRLRGCFTSDQPRRPNETPRQE